MLTALLSFLGGSFARMLLGEIFSFITKWQDHKQEVELMEIQGRLAGQQHARNMDAIKQQAEMQIKVIEVQAEAAVGQTEAMGWLEAVKATAIKTGVAWVDAWNASIRPAVATWAVAMMTMNEFHLISMSEFAMSVSGAALGIYLADRNLMKRGK